MVVRSEEAFLGLRQTSLVVQHPRPGKQELGFVLLVVMGENNNSRSPLAGTNTLTSPVGSGAAPITAIGRCEIHPGHSPN